MTHRLMPLLALLLALALPAAAAAQSSPFQPLPPPRPEPLPEPEPAPGTVEEDGLDTWQSLLILAAAASLIGGIALFVVRDARARRPVQEPTPFEAGSGRRSAEDRRKTKQKSRAAAKRAKQARRRNR